MEHANLPTNANAASCRCGNALPHVHKTSNTREYYNGGGVPQPGKDVRRVNAQMTGTRCAGLSRATNPRSLLRLEPPEDRCWAILAISRRQRRAAFTVPLLRFPRPAVTPFNFS